MATWRLIGLAVGVIAGLGSGAVYAEPAIQIGCTGTTDCASAAVAVEDGISKGVSFVEVTFPTMNDVLKSGAVDAVVTAEPVLSRIGRAGTGTVVANYLAELPPHEPQILYAATRSWEEANPKAVEAFRASIREAAEIVNRDPDKGRAAISRFTKIPLDVLKTMKLSISDPVITPAQIDWWVGVMKQQDMLQTSPDAKAIIAP